jgi:hypothetical protein
MKRLTLPIPSCRAIALAVALSLCSLPHAQAQGEGPPPQGVSRGENFSAKPPAQLFASDCTGAGCHKGPQGLGKNAGLGGLAGFLREHYTNSRESAAALANYLAKLPSGPEPKEARTPRTGRAAVAPPSGAPGWGEGLGLPGLGEAKPAAKPEPKEAHTPRQTPSGRASRAAAKSEEEPVATPPAIHQHHPVAEPPETAAKPAEAKPTRAQRGHQPATAAVVTPAAPAPTPTPEAAPAPEPPPPPQPKQYDIFD